MAYTVTEDDEFAAFAKRAEEEAQNNKGGSNFAPRDYDPIKWVGLEDKAKIVRIVGGAPSSMKPGAHVLPTDAHELFISKILDDNGKRMKLKLPLHSDDMNTLCGVSLIRLMRYHGQRMQQPEKAQRLLNIRINLGLKK